MARAYARSVATERMAVAKRMIAELMGRREDDHRRAALAERRRKRWLRAGSITLLSLFSLGLCAAAFLR